MSDPKRLRQAEHSANMAELREAKETLEPAIRLVKTVYNEMEYDYRETIEGIEEGSNQEIQFAVMRSVIAWMEQFIADREAKCSESARILEEE